ncbi:SusD/RagB family nutrient-binding outer membrane lipoprotein [Chitinophagaceae bacterium LB-8]|uniref:SusD/RagB family nutrient-binding outer membrane lipoprotein n=1 Tax=Paraflavisolibacter caeni TaxID=2982496 RepID=A0A9X2XNF7_9BACT|nr:SusD/RagB family nutrient-binding outer membrane lipoprotein [Paraflavisolibacter caeni]MCU7548638.1 SusD/RagB family nutrient-binding outer membrane lipoprotein [Paraflavisolibacter caeni]
MKKLLIISISLFTLAACTKDIEQFNEQTKNAAQAPAGTLFSNAVRNFADGLTSASVNLNVFRQTVQHWAATTYQDEPNYDFTTRNIPQAWWLRMYRDVLVDLKEAKRLAPLDITISEATKKNRVAIADIMQVYTYSVLVNTFGNVPYLESLDYDNLFPKYDDAKTIYDDLLKRINDDLAALNESGSGFESTSDFVYGGDIPKWKKFANSLKIKLAMTIADADAAKAKLAVEEAVAAGVITSADDNAIVKYSATTPNTNPIWVDLVQSNRQDWVAANTFVDKLKELSDPRLSLYLKPNDAGVYVGGVSGSNNTYANCAKVSNKIIDPALPGLLLDYVEVEFYKAEAKERGFNVAGTAEEHYNNAIKASILYWGGTVAQADTYLQSAGVAYTTAAGSYKQKIGSQKWIALFNRGFEAWTEYRRLDYPVLTPPATAKSGYPNRFTYPTNEQTVNKTNYKDASAKIGGDKVETKLFWDKY